jgi:alkylation response protein AidB-like acyl-CoA dehydrogenase
MSTPYRVDLDDVRFVLFEQLKIHERLKDLPRYADFDRDVYDATLSEAERFAVEVLSPLSRVGDRKGCLLDGDGNVTTPIGFNAAWTRMAEGGWISPSADAELGGGGLPIPMHMAVNDMLVGAAMSFMMYPGLTSAAANVTKDYAPEGMRELVTRKLLSGEWGGTMCLTESGAGSSVGDSRTKATPDPDHEGMWLIEGEKIWITGADSDMVSNIVHLVLARTPGSPTGTKGLSLFLVPKFMFDPATGELGERNGAYVTGLEHKMGLNASATTFLAFGARSPARGWLVGSEREGITIMFRMMNEARIGVAAQGQATAATAYQFALQYAKDRVQGAPLHAARDPEATSVTITAHPDVRRMLMTMKVCSETMRSALLKVSTWHDLGEHGAEGPERDRLLGLVDLLTPVIKGHFTDLGFEMAVLGLQVYGGYGFTQEYPIEQLVRDSKIQSIYEGTNGIQALDLLGRKLRIKGGALFMSWMQEAQATIARAAEAGFGELGEAVGKSVQLLGASAMHLGKLAGEGKIDGAFLQATPFLRMFGIVLLAVEALDQATVAKAKLDAGEDSPLLRGKLLGAPFYVHNLLPQAVGLAKAIQSGDESPLDAVLFA